MEEHLMLSGEVWGGKNKWGQYSLDISKVYFIIRNTCRKIKPLLGLVSCFFLI